MSEQLPKSGDLDLTDNITRNRLDVHLAELQSVQQELSARFDNQRQSFNYLLITIGLLATIISSENFKLEDEFIKELSFYVPLVLAPFGFIFFDNELMIWGIIRYICHHLRNCIKELVNDDKVMVMEMNRFKENNTRIIHYLLSLSRWLIFVLPVLASTLYASYLLYLSSRHNPLPEHQLKSLTYILYWCILLMDYTILTLLIVAIYKAGIQQRMWKHLMGISNFPTSGHIFIPFIALTASKPTQNYHKR